MKTKPRYKAEALYKLEELVDKATPKKIVYVKIFGNYVSTCPTCTCGVFSKDDIDNPIMYKAKYCSNCGQRLDWSEIWKT